MRAITSSRAYATDTPNIVMGVSPERSVFSKAACSGFKGVSNRPEIPFLFLNRIFETMFVLLNKFLKTVCTLWAHGIFQGSVCSSLMPAVALGVSAGLPGPVPTNPRALCRGHPRVAGPAGGWPGRPGRQGSWSPLGPWGRKGPPLGPGGARFASPQAVVAPQATPPARVLKDAPPGDPPGAPPRRRPPGGQGAPGTCV